MQLNMTGHHVEVTPPMRDYATKRVERLQKHFERIISIDLTFNVEKLDQIVKAHIHTPGANFNANSKAEDIYSAIDLLVDKLDRQIKKHREKETGHH